jgi:hypothetical protein
MKQSTREAIRAHADRRVLVGWFVTKVLENDLAGAVRLAGANLRDLPEIVRYCCQEIPSRCWGSPQKVRAWLKEEPGLPLGPPRRSRGSRV